LGVTDPEGVIFTSSGTESNHLAVRGVLEAAPTGSRWAVSSVEHDSFEKLQTWAVKRGIAVDVVPADSQGRISSSALRDCLRPETVLFSLNWVNNETGVIQDLSALRSELLAFAKDHKTRPPLFQVDGAQAWGKLPINLDALGVDLACFSGHKIGALAGCAVLWRKPGVELAPIFPGKQEGGLRGGTENLLGIYALGVASQALDPSAYEKDLKPLREHLEKGILERLHGAQINGRLATRVANTVNVSFGGSPLESGALIQSLDREGFAVSAGSACSSGVSRASAVLLAMGLSEELARRTLRISLPQGTRRENLDALMDSLSRILAR
jgi:cysteine desulfurase